MKWSYIQQTQNVYRSHMIYRIKKINLTDMFNQKWNVMQLKFEATFLLENALSIFMHHFAYSLKFKT